LTELIQNAIEDFKESECGSERFREQEEIFKIFIYFESTSFGLEVKSVVQQLVQLFI
jgi:hypothetical protein